MFLAGVAVGYFATYRPAVSLALLLASVPAVWWWVQYRAQIIPDQQASKATA
jgi:hypothetical protein